MKVDGKEKPPWGRVGWSLLPIYFLSLVALFLYTLFPSETVKRHLSERFQRAAPECALTVVGLALAFPPGLKADGLKVDCLDREVVVATDVTLTPRWTDLLAGGFSADISGAAYGGMIRSRIEYQDQSDRPRWSTTAHVAGVDLFRAAAIRDWTGYGIAGRLEGDFRLELAAAHPADATLTIIEAVIDPPAPVMNVRRLQFDRVTARLAVDRRLLTLTEVEFSGPQLDGRMAGLVFLKETVGTSRLDLEGWARPKTEFLAGLDGVADATFEDRRLIAENGFSFHFGGTCDYPEVSIWPGVSQ